MKKGLTDNIKLAGYDEIFPPENEQQGQSDTVALVSISDLYPFPDHPFKVVDDEKMEEMTESVREYGVLTPIIVRPKEEGSYEIVAGHRRHRAAVLSGLRDIPAIIRNLDDDAAVILMVDSNLQRETVLPSEKAKSYKMKLDAMKRQGERTDLTSSPLGMKSQGKQSLDKLGESVGESRNQIHRYMRLTELDAPLLEMVDDNKLPFRAAVEISYLTPYEQALLTEAMERDEVVPTLNQAARLKEFSRNNKLDENVIAAILSEEKPADYKVTLKGDKLRKYFPASYTPRQMEDTILKLLDKWQRDRRRDRGR